MKVISSLVWSFSMVALTSFITSTVVASSFTLVDCLFLTFLTGTNNGSCRPSPSTSLVGDDLSEFDVDGSSAYLGWQESLVLANLVPRVSHPGGGKMRDPGNEVVSWPL